MVLRPLDLTARIDSGRCAGAGLHHALLVAGRGLATWSRASPQPQGPVDPRGGLPARFAGEVDSLLGEASYGARRVALAPVCTLVVPGTSPNDTTFRVGTGNPARFRLCRAGPESAGSQRQSGRCLRLRLAAGRGPWLAGPGTVTRAGLADSLCRWSWPRRAVRPGLGPCAAQRSASAASLRLTRRRLRLASPAAAAGGGRPRVRQA